MDEVSQPPEIRSVTVSGNSNQLETLTQLCVDDVLSAFGLGGLRHGRSIPERIFRTPARRLSLQILDYDRIVGESGLEIGGAWALKRMCRRVEVTGQESVPPEGPVLIVSNHPGLADAVALFSVVSRRDLRVVAAERPFLGALPNTSRYLLTVAKGSPGNFGLVRAATRHLRLGGAVLTFPGGRIEPDPAVLPGAVEALESWSASVNLFARLTPGLVTVPVIVGGVLSPTALRNPLTYLRRQRSDREWLAATLQMLTPKLRDVSVKVMFGDPIQASPDNSVGEAVLLESRRLIGRLRAG